jgi:very-short-patch-repair endonuclease
MAPLPDAVPGVAERAHALCDEVLRRSGYRVLRLDAELVERELAVAVARIREELLAVK